MKKNKKPLKNRTKFVIVSIVHIDIYAIVAMICFMFGKEVSDAFTVGWFALWSGELAGLLGIKIYSMKKGESS